jgi:cell division protein FtsQ
MSETYAERKKRERLEKLREARKRQTRKLAILASSLLAAFLLALFLINSPYFKVKEVSVKRVDHLSESEEKRIEELLLDKNIFFAPTGRAKSALQKNPWIKDVRFRKDFPSKIIVMPVERKPVGQIAFDSRYYLIASDGMILDVIDEPAPLIQIADLPIKTVKVGTILKKKELEDAIKVYESLPENLKKRVLIISAASSDKLIFYIEGIEVIYGAPEYTEEKNQILIEVLKREGEKAIYIDLRVPDSPVVKTKP